MTHDTYLFVMSARNRIDTGAAMDDVVLTGLLVLQVNSAAIPAVLVETADEGLVLELELQGGRIRCRADRGAACTLRRHIERGGGGNS